MKYKNNIKQCLENWFNFVVIGYILFPFLIFIIGWTKPAFAIIVSLVLVYLGIRTIKNANIVNHEIWKNAKIATLLFAVIIIFLWVYFSGIGGLVYQTADHTARNGLFNLLVSEHWPVTSVVEFDGTMMTRGISYYFAFWMPAALIGKLFGLQAGYLFQALWAVLGVFIFYILLCNVRKKIEVWPLLVFIIFSGLDVLGLFVSYGGIQAIPLDTRIEWWSRYFNYVGSTLQLFWIYNHAIYTWIITLLLYHQKCNKYMVFFLSLIMMGSTFSFVGLLPFAAYWCMTRDYGEKWISKKWWTCWMKDSFSIENIVGGGIVGFVSYFFLSSRDYFEKESKSFFFNFTKASLMNYVLFIIIAFGLYWVVTWLYHKKDIERYLVLIWLCLCPAIGYGDGRNFVMKASAPALLLLFLYVVKALEEYYKSKKKSYFAILIAMLLISSVTTIHEFTHTISHTNICDMEGTSVMATPTNKEGMLRNRFESVNVENSIFYKYLAK